MRISFINTLETLAEKDNNIFLLSPDMGFSVFERFKDRFSDRFINTGIAEANTIGISAGLALTGKTVYVYSIVPFVTMRCFEQIRVDICYQGLDVKLIGVGGGLCYGTAGATHHSIEDVAVMRALPNMTVICPGDPVETALAVEESSKNKGPVYIRLSKAKDPLVHKTKDMDFRIGKGIILEKGDDITIIATGGMLNNSWILAAMLKQKGISVRLISMHTVKPIDRELVLKAVKETKAIFTVEEHSLIGGLGSSVAEVIAEERARDVFFEKIALPDSYNSFVGSQNYLHEKYGLLPGQIMEHVLKVLNKV